MNLFKKKSPYIVKGRLPHIHERYKLGPCPICGQTNWKNDTDCRNESTCQVCGLRFNYPYDYEIEERNKDRLHELNIEPYSEVASKERRDKIEL
jgi:predicted RNA-binding Zn-ribbon protein involved in translation (DUF1610 family)